MSWQAATRGPPAARAVLPFEKTLEVRDRCLCLFVQRAARVLARRFDDVFRALHITQGQYSLMMALNRPQPAVMGEIAALLDMDRTTLTAALKSLERRGLVVVGPDPDDGRRRRLALTTPGRELLAAAYPRWRCAHDALEASLATPGAGELRAALGELARMYPGVEAKRRRGQAPLSER